MCLFIPLPQPNVKLSPHSAFHHCYFFRPNEGVWAGNFRQRSWRFSTTSLPLHLRAFMWWRSSFSVLPQISHLAPRSAIIVSFSSRHWEFSALPTQTCSGGESRLESSPCSTLPEYKDFRESVSDIWLLVSHSGGRGRDTFHHCGFPSYIWVHFPVVCTSRWCVGVVTCVVWQAKWITVDWPRSLGLWLSL